MNLEKPHINLNAVRIVARTDDPSDGSVSLTVYGTTPAEAIRKIRKLLKSSHKAKEQVPSTAG